MTVALFSLLFSIAVALGGILLAVAVLGGLGFFLYRRSRMRDAAKQAAQTWFDTTGVVISSAIQVKRTGRSRSEIPVVIYQYQVDGRPYVGKVIKAGDQFFSVRLYGDAQKTVERYPVGAQVTVHYNPADPAQSALER
jgi:Protein of unknown function (DUF3592)